MPRDVFCGNYGHSRGGFNVCRRTWHPKCYAAREDIKFHIAQPESDEGAIWIKSKDERRFLEARPGDGVCAPFQCDHCWFINLKGRAANDQFPSDSNLLGLIRRVNLDIMWS